MFYSVLAAIVCSTIFWSLVFAGYCRWLAGRREASYMNNVIKQRHRYEQQRLRLDQLSHWRPRADARLLSTADTRRHAVVRRNSR